MRVSGINRSYRIKFFLKICLQFKRGAGLGGAVIGGSGSTKKLR